MSESLLVVGLKEYVRIVASRSSERLANDGRRYKACPELAEGRHQGKNAETIVVLGLEHDFERSYEISGLKHR